MSNSDILDCNNGRTSSEEFEELLEKIGEEIFWGANNLNGETGDKELMPYMENGICKPCPSNVSEVQRALKIMGYDTHMLENGGKSHLMQGDSCKPQKKERNR